MTGVICIYHKVQSPSDLLGFDLPTFFGGNWHIWAEWARLGRLLGIMQPAYNALAMRRSGLYYYGIASPMSFQQLYQSIWLP